METVENCEMYEGVISKCHMQKLEQWAFINVGEFSIYMSIDSSQ